MNKEIDMGFKEAPNRRVEFKLNEQLHEALREAISVGDIPRKTFPRGFLESLFRPYILYYLKHPEIVEQLMEANVNETTFDLTKL